MLSRLTLPLAVAFLFYVGAISGWVLEFLYRNLISHRGPKGRYVINPGFCKGPWLPIYGVGIVVLCLLSELIYSKMDPAIVGTIPGKIISILVMGLCMNIVEFIGGFILLKFFNLRLWDYRDRPGNFMGIVCPMFAVIWTVISAIYYLFIHRITLEYLSWFSGNLAFSFFVGMFFGFFILDIWFAFSDAIKVKHFAKARDLIVRYEDLKDIMQQQLMKKHKKQHFFHQVLTSGMSPEAALEACKEAMEEKKDALKAKFGRQK